MSNEKKQVKTNDLLIPIEVINKFPLLSKISIVLLLEVYKSYHLHPELYFTNREFKDFDYARASCKKFILECEKHDLIKVFYSEDAYIVLINNEKGVLHYNYLNQNKNKGKRLWQIVTTDHKFVPVIQKDKINKNAGFVYLLKYGSQYKIGCSNNIDKRLHDLQKNTPHQITLIHSIKTNNKYTLEKELHRKYKDKRVNGEWFDLLESDVEYITKLVGDN